MKTISTTKSDNFVRAKNMVMQDKFDFAQEQFCKELTNFLSNYFVFDGLTLDAVQGKSNNLVLCVNVKNVKKSRTL